MAAAKSWLGAGPKGGSVWAFRRMGLVAEAKAFGLSRAERLSRPADFRRAARIKGRLTAHFRVVAMSAQNGRRLGLTVSKQVGRAVQRNRLKRQVREFFRQNKDRLPQADLVVIARRGAAGLETRAVFDELGQVLLSGSSPAK